MSTTKIICTIGPKSNNRATLQKYYKAGMNVARLNGSHNNLDWHKKTISLIQDTLPEMPIILDIPGKKIRTLDLAHEPSFKIGDQIILTTDRHYDGKQKVPVGHKTLHGALRKNDVIFADDGQLKFVVKKIFGHDIYCEAQVSGTLKSRKGINVPDVKLSKGLISARDKTMLKFVCENNVDFVGISFVESKKHIEAIKRALIKYAKDPLHPPKIVAKVENRIGLENVEEILSAADAIMIDRGDLAVETDLPHVILYQKIILARALSYGVPVIVATEMLNTMITQPTPTKAEIADITNAILDKAAAIMLSGETAVGHYGVEAISVMKQLTELVPNFQNPQTLKNQSEDSETLYYLNLIHAAKALCDAMPITKIVSITKSGMTAQVMSSLEPTQEILCITDNQNIAKSANLLYGTRGIYINTQVTKNSKATLKKVMGFLVQKKLLKSDDFILVLFSTYSRVDRLTNAIQLHYVRDILKD